MTDDYAEALIKTLESVRIALWAHIVMTIGDTAAKALAERIRDVAPTR